MSNTDIHVSGNSIISFTKTIVPFDELPKFVDEALPLGTETLGLTTVDGENITRGVTTTNLASHQEANVRTLVTEGTFTLECSAMESNKLARNLYFASEADAVSGHRDVDLTKTVRGTLFYDSIDISDGFEKTVRYSAIATVTPNGAIGNTRGDASVLPLLFTIEGKVRIATELEGE